jgi:hypothetical protein
MRLSFKEARSIDRAISPDRMATYLSEAGSNRRLARELYIWDRDLSVAMFADIAILEVALRNAIHREASAAHGVRWFDAGGLPLDGRSLNTLSRAWEDLPSHIRQNSQASTFPGRLVARLMFGFWRDLFDAGGYAGKEPRRAHIDYEDNWRQTLHRVFPGGKPVARELGAQYSRVWALRQITEVHALRNRVGHHEPLVRGFPIPGQQQQRLTAAEGHEACIRLARMLDRDLAVWLKRSSDVPMLLAMCPGTARPQIRSPRIRATRLLR